MNSKTTLTLAFSLVVLVLLYYVMQSRRGAAETAEAVTPIPASKTTTRDLLETKLGDVVKVVCKRKDQEEWVFEKDTEPSGTGQGAWRMTSPKQMSCVRWEVEKFGSQLSRLKYELSYAPGELGAVTAAQAGLEPPEATVTLTDVDGQSVSVEIGKPASSRETYVRLAGSDVICVGQSDLRNLVKEKALDYREQQLWNFKTQDATRVEIIDRSDPATPISYVFARDGARWMMESPVAARATGKVDDMLSSMSRLRATQWYDDRADRVAMYGLDPAVLTINVTVEEEVPVEEPAGESGDDGNSGEKTAEPKTKTKTTVYGLRISDRSPIGEDTKTYMRIAGESAVATVMKTVADKFKPVMNEWREMRVTAVDTATATRIELDTPSGPTVLEKIDGDWTFQPDGGRAETSAVTELLHGVAELRAVAYVDNASVDPASLGFDAPQAEIRLTIPGAEGRERITIGAFTDQQSRRLIYVRRNDVDSIAKVRAADVAKLTRGPRHYRNRAIVDIPPSRFKRIMLSSENRFGDGRIEFTLERAGNEWSMVEPIAAQTREDQVDKLLEALGGLRAEQVVADEAEGSAFGLHAPSVTLSLTHQPPSEYRIENDGDDATSTESAEDKRAKPVEVQPPPQTLVLSVSEHDGKYYAKRSDRGTIYQVSESFFKTLMAEYRTDRVLDFDETKVREFSIRKDDQIHVFQKKGDGWVYQAEPDLPLDTTKVDNLLLQLRDLRTDRFVRYGAGDLGPYGLTRPRHEVTVRLDDGAQHTLSVSSRRTDRGDGGYYASSSSDPSVFLLTEEAVNRFTVSLDTLEAQP